MGVPRRGGPCNRCSCTTRRSVEHLPAKTAGSHQSGPSLFLVTRFGRCRSPRLGLSGRRRCLRRVGTNSFPARQIPTAEGHPESLDSTPAPDEERSSYNPVGTTNLHRGSPFLPVPNSRVATNQTVPHYSCRFRVAGTIVRYLP